ncbi:YdeI/OmpD-associated family protein [Microbacterium sp. X-17]|uniref:YdeI/OmpD-associated family protein n=1 Tax=Microbacterium sp. X-17 TaxID=3144404 RepID=UPI0031F493E8
MTERFQTTLLQTGNNTGIEVSPEIIESLGGGKRPAVVVRVGAYEYRSTVGVMQGRYLIPFSAERRAESGLRGGDAISVEVELDTAPREVAVPDDLAVALDGAGLRAAFDRLPPSHRKAHVTSVESAKAAETRTRRIEAVVAKLSI